MNDGKHYTRLEDNAIKKYDLTTGEFVEDILTGDELKAQEGFNGQISSYSFNHDESNIMIGSEKESIYRRSSKAFYYTYDVEDKTLQSIYPEDKIMYATLSPDGAYVAYVWKNNLYYKELETGITLPVTSDGVMNQIINGSADWVYEEEFSIAKFFFWSPDSKKIAYVKFDESEVKEFTMTNYRDGLYPEYVTFKYPKVGEENAKVSVHVFDLEADQTLDLEFGTSEEYYIPRIRWTEDTNELCVYKMNRHQNEVGVIPGRCIQW